MRHVRYYWKHTTTFIKAFLVRAKHMRFTTKLHALYRKAVRVFLASPLWQTRIIKKLNIHRFHIHKIQRKHIIRMLPLAAIILGIFIFNALPKKPQPKTAQFHNAPLSKRFVATDKNTNLTTSLEAKKNELVMEVKRGEAKTSFSMAVSHASANQTNNDTISYSLPTDTTVKYETIPEGIKEEIILNKPLGRSTIMTTLTVENVEPYMTSEGQIVFLDDNGDYQFHIRQPFAVDANGVVTHNIKYRLTDYSDTYQNIKKDINKHLSYTRHVLGPIDTKQSAVSLSNTYTMILELDPTWFKDSTRAYPITIDPTVVHDTSSEFTAGSLNRIKDTGSGSSPQLTTNYQELVTDTNTLALWHMNENALNTCTSGVNDICSTTGTAFDAQFANSAAFTTSNVLGTSGITLPGSNSIAYTAAYTMPANSPFTVEAWVNPTIANTTSGGILTYANASIGWGLYLANANLPSIWTSTGSSLTSPTAIPTNQWSHVAATLSSTGVKILYVNGVEVARTTGAGYAAPAAGTGFLLGRFYWNDAANYFYTGLLDEVRLSGVVRSPEEIKLSAQRRPYSTYTSEVIDLGGANSWITNWNAFNWSEHGVTTGDGETLKDTSSLVAQWNFNETSGTTATNNAGSCGASCNGTLSNMTTSGQDAAVNSGWTANNKRWGAGALMFDGSNDYINFGDVELVTGNQMSIEAWVFIRSLTEYESILSKNASTYAFALHGDTTTGKLRFWVDNNDYTTDAESDNTLTDGKWHYVVGVYDGTLASANTKMYIDGKLQAKTANQTITIPNTADPLVIGAYSATPAGPFDGIIDSLRLYSRPLTASEIISNYQAGNVEFQTRVGSSTTPDDGTWEAWKPTSNETQLASLDTYSPTGCTGGTILEGGRIHKFTSSDTFTCTGSGSVEVMIVAGGGGGGMDMGGGGGGGGVLYKSDYAISANTPVTVTVGAGGAGAPAGGVDGQPTAHQYTIGASNGENSTFGTLTAVGGGRGGSSYYAYTPGAAGAAGGSGGGASGYSSGGTTTGGAGTAGQGYVGGQGGGQYYSGGGGGAGYQGTNSTSRADGGRGLLTDILGPWYYWGGGGGGAGYSIHGGWGGNGGGGAGAIGWPEPLGGSGLNKGSNGYMGNTGRTTDVSGGNGGANTGGGGGGGSHYNRTNKGGDGGSGIVIVRLSKTTKDTVVKYEGAASQKFTTGKTTSDSSTVGLWHFDETGGTSAYIKNSSSYTAPTVATGTGNDGDCIINNGTKMLDTTVGSSVCNGSARTTAYAVKFSDTTIENAGESSVTLSTTPTGFAAGDEFLIINLMGTVADYESVGYYETHTISSISTNTLNFTDSPLAHTYDGTTQKIMVQRVPNFGNVTICGGNTGGGCTAAAEIHATAFDGTMGGVLFFRSTGTVTVNSGGYIYSGAKGYTGGATTGGNGYSGQSYIGSGIISSVPNRGGGGGGIVTNSNVGGGAGGSHMTWGGNGVHNGTLGTNSGIQGNPYDQKQDPDDPRLFFGSGGGGGSYSNSPNGIGGVGGGIVYISATTIANSGTISVVGGSGAAGYGPEAGAAGGGGGGSGGTIHLRASTITGGSIFASGGSGGAGTYAGGSQGGAGGNGKVILYGNTVTNSSNVTPQQFSATNIDGTPTGTSVAKGLHDKARYFAGTANDYITVPHAQSLQPNQLTVSVWFKPESSVNAITKFNGSTDGWVVIPGSSGFWCWINGTWNSAVAKTNLNDGAWHHGVCTYDGQYIRTYVDGVYENATAKAGASADLFFKNTNNLIIGANSYKGTLDELVIKNSAINAEEVQTLYQIERNNPITIPLSSTDLTTATSLPFAIAADKPGTYISATIGETAYANYQPDANTIGFWHFNEDNPAGYFSIKDSSVNRHYGTQTGTTWAKGKLGNGKLFNGSSDYITIDNSTLFDVSNLTIEAWAYSSNFAQNGFIFEKGPVNTQYSCFFASANGIIFRTLNAAAAQDDLIVTLATAGVANNQWNHLACTYDGSNKKIYVNGVLVASKAYTETLRTGQSGERIGAYGGTASYFFNGVLDEVRISNVARSAEDIRQAYDVGLRTHSVTIDFGAKLDSGNLITGSGDLSFTVDATTFGLPSKGSALFTGDKIIIRENYNGTEYIAQGTVTSITASTGATTVVSWDANSTFPSGGYTANASVFKWQKEYWNIDGETLDSSVNAVTNLTFQLTDSIEGRTIWLDDFQSLTHYQSTRSWYNASWPYRVKLTIDASKVDADLTDFPVYVNLNNLPAGFHTNVNQTDARDIRVTKSDGITELPREVVFYTAASDTGEAHFKYTGTLSGTTNTDVYIYYGNASASDYATNATYGAENVWDSNYAGVYHLTETSSSRLDSTSKSNDLSLSSTVGYSTSGQLGTAANFTSAGNLYRTDANLSTDFPGKSAQTTTSFTASYWVRPNSFGWADWLGKRASAGDGWLHYAPTNQVTSTYESNSTWYSVSSAASSLGTGNWYAVTSVHNASSDTDYVYVNGVQSGIQTSRTNDPDANSGSFMVGGTDQYPNEASGLFDEVRISNSARSATWTSTEYNNQFSPSSFYAVGTQETSASPLRINSSTGYRYFQYRAILTSFDEAVSATLSAVTLDYTINTPPLAPSLDLPTDTATNQILSPVLKTTTTDADSDYMKYKIELCTDIAMTTNCQTFDQTSSQTGWSGQNTQTNTAYTSGTQGTYTIQTPLSANTTYYWRSYAIDPAGTNTWGATQTPYSFTTTAAPSAPTSLLAEGTTNPTNVTDATPEFSAIYNDSNTGDIANKYEIQVDDTSNFSSVVWDSGAAGTSLANCAQGARCADISYAGSALSQAVTYYWRIKFWDNNGVEGAWSSETATFILNSTPLAPSLDSPTDTATNRVVLPNLKTTGSDINADYLRYKILLCTNSGMTTNCQTFDQTSSQTGWSGQNSQSNTAYTSGSQASYTIQTPLSISTTYYWKSYCIDPAGANVWSPTQNSPFSFTTSDGVDSFRMEGLNLEGININ